MALKRCFVAEDRIPYRAWPRDEPIHAIHYNGSLIATPRAQHEDLGSIFVPSQPQMVVWVTKDGNAWGPCTINVLANVVTVRWPGWGRRLWKFDAQHGRLLTREAVGGLPVQASDGFTQEAETNAFWWFGVHADAYAGGATLLELQKGYGGAAGAPCLSLAATSTVVRPSDFRTVTGAVAIAMSDFAIDRAADRVFVRWTSDGVGTVNIYKLSTRELLHQIWAPNATSGIVLSHDGFLYLCDVCDWMCVYDYDGVLHNAFRNPRREVFPGGYVYGWDQVYKRLLFVGAVADSTSGGSRLRVRGYYPIPEPFFLSPPIPLQVPRAGRRVRVLSHLSGEGAEPLANRAAKWDGDLSASGSSDQDGDFVANVTPSAAGSLAAEVTANEEPSAELAAEPDETLAGRTLVVTLTSPATDAQEFPWTDDGPTPVPLRATVEGASGAVTVRFRVSGGGIRKENGGIPNTLSILPPKEIFTRSGQRYVWKARPPTDVPGIGTPYVVTEGGFDPDDYGADIRDRSTGEMVPVDVSDAWVPWWPKWDPATQTYGAPAPDGWDPNGGPDQTILPRPAFPYDARATLYVRDFIASGGGGEGEVYETLLEVPGYFDTGYLVTAYAVDSLGNTGMSAPRPFFYDSIPPADWDPDLPDWPPAADTIVGLSSSTTLQAARTTPMESGIIFFGGTGNFTVDWYVKAAPENGNTGPDWEAAAGDWVLLGTTSGVVAVEPGGGAARYGIAYLRQHRWLPPGHYSFRQVVTDSAEHTAEFVQTTNYDATPIAVGSGPGVISENAGLKLSLLLSSVQRVELEPYTSPAALALGTQLLVTASVEMAVGDVTLIADFQRTPTLAGDPAMGDDTIEGDAPLVAPPEEYDTFDVSAGVAEHHFVRATRAGDGSVIFTHVLDKAGGWFVTVFAVDSQTAWDGDGPPSGGHHPNRALASLGLTAFRVI